MDMRKTVSFILLLNKNCCIIFSSCFKILFIFLNFNETKIVVKITVLVVPI